MRDTVTDDHAAIALSSVTVAAGGDTLMNLPKLEIRNKGLTVLMGPNGSGKSLLLRLMHGLVEPTTGSISVNGEPLTASHRKDQSLVFQRPVLLRRSAAANIDFVLRSRRKPKGKRAELLKMVGLEQVAHRPARRLSGGEQQRLAIARALATEPSTLFLDEPTASLDPAAVSAIERIVARIVAAGIHVIFVTHDIAQARRLADHVVFLHNGTLAEQAEASTFFESPKSEAARAYLDGRLMTQVGG